MPHACVVLPSERFTTTTNPRRCSGGWSSHRQRGPPVFVNCPVEIDAMYCCSIPRDAMRLVFLLGRRTRSNHSFSSLSMIISKVSAVMWSSCSFRRSWFTASSHSASCSSISYSTCLARSISSGSRLHYHEHQCGSFQLLNPHQYGEYKALPS